MELLDVRTNIQPNAIMFSHTDLDGIGCGILFKGAIGSESEVYYCNYGDIDDVIQRSIENIRKRREDRPQIIISDLGISEETARIVDNYEGDKILLDHHGTNEWLGEKYSWAIIDEQESGTLLVYHYLNVPSKYEEFAIMVDDYDRWIHANPDSKQLNRLFFVMGINRFEERCLERLRPTEFDDVDKLLLEIEEENLERHIERAGKYMTTHPMFGDKQIGVLFADRYQSETGHELLNQFDVEVVAMIDPNTKKVSLRSNPKFDVGSVAKRLGGGGHKNAAGVEFNYKDVTDFHGSKYPLYGVKDAIDEAKYSLAAKVNIHHTRIETEAVSKMLNQRSGQ
ncbi:DHH family phosphoesterase [Halobacillus ihumii]|uniref:DHH family phosphoesterase n=1 Tax=Halobacillus ihumii TaxID=2686092 RepID=UPI0013D7EB92|nr:DHHA1 domain-containing protein [Halobacillus ihumii]